MDPWPIRPAVRPLDSRLRAVPSKSVTHRALVAAALVRGVSEIDGPLVADDTLATLRGLQQLGVRVEVAEAQWRIHGLHGEPPGGARLELGDSGTSMRFLLALAALGKRPSALDGSTRLRERPVRDLARALVDIGGQVELAARGGGLPARAGGRPPIGGQVRVRGDRSSQFASALLLVGSALPRGLELALEPPVVSLPYVDLTVRVLDRFGVQAEPAGPLRWRVAPGLGTACVYRVEGDHSAASYFLAAAAVVGGRVRVLGLDPESAQPDAGLAALLERAGCRVQRGDDWIEVVGTGRLRALDEDLGHAPDLVPTLATMALFADGETTLRGIAHLRDKESDRLEALAGNLRALGCAAVIGTDRLVVSPAPDRHHGAVVRTAGDHRIAMAFAVAGLRLAGVALDEPDCVSKSNPEFWRQLERLTG